MVNLDSQEEIIKTQGGTTVIESVDALPKQLKQSFTETGAIKFPEEYKTVKKIVVCGMGGSRFPALIANFLFKDLIQLPYVTNDDYILPGYVDTETLVILSSYSGTTEEVVYCGKEAYKRGAKLTGIAMGGDVESFLKSINAPSYIFVPTYNPSGQPRIGFGYNVGGQLGLLFNLGFIKSPIAAVTDALNSLDNLIKNFKITVSTKENPAKQLAQILYQKYPYYIVSEFLTGVGNAIANQTNETAKSISSFRVIPEINHHLLEGLRFPDALHSMALFVFFYSSLYGDQIQKRFHITKDVLEQNKVQTIWHELKGNTKVEQVFELMALGGYISMYLAALYNQSPTSIPYVDYFKKKLQETK